MTTFVLVRHGYVEGIDPMRFRGRRDLPLTEKGRKQAQAVARRIAATLRPDAIYASPLSRTVDTAEAIAAAVGSGLEVTRVPELIDIDYGRWHGLSLDEARAGWPAELELWLKAPQLAAIPQGETLQGVLARAAHALTTLRRRHPDQTVVLVSHDSVNRIILLYALDASLSDYWRIEQAPCCINEFTFQDDSFRIVRMNDTAHLEPSLDG